MNPETRRKKKKMPKQLVGSNNRNDGNCVRHPAQGRKKGPFNHNSETEVLGTKTWGRGQAKTRKAKGGWQSGTP